nr:unnamed protein product [Callosobruchus chinensis]
MNSGTK